MIRFVFPLDGDCLNSRDGKLNGNKLCVTVKVEAPEKNDVYICNKKAVYDTEYFTADVEISGYRNTLTAEDKTSGECAKIAVFKLNDVEGKYRVWEAGT